MISLTLTYTDSLGPEADIRALLHKLAVRLKAAAGDEAPLLVAARALREYVVVGEDEWAMLSGELAIPAALEASFGDAVVADLLGVADAHFAELYGRRCIALAFERRIRDASLAESRHCPPPTADTF